VCSVRFEKDLAMPHGLRKKIVSSHRFREKSMFAIQHGSYGASCRKVSQKEIVQHQTLNGFVQRRFRKGSSVLDSNLASGSSWVRRQNNLD